MSARLLPVLAVLLVLPACTTRQVVLEEVAAPVPAGITPLTLEQNAQISE